MTAPREDLERLSALKWVGVPPREDAAREQHGFQRVGDGRQLCPVAPDARDDRRGRSVENRLGSLVSARALGARTQPWDRLVPRLAVVSGWVGAICCSQRAVRRAARRRYGDHPEERTGATTELRLRHGATF